MFTPKIFHTVHFSNAPTTNSPHIHRALLSQKKYLSDYDCRVWTEDDFLRIIKINDWYVPYGDYLLEIGAWAIISDIIRLYALYTEGGIYADWDVEFVQAVPEWLHEHAVVLGFEPYTHSGRGTAQVGAQFCMSDPKHSLWMKIFAQITTLLWTSHFDILPGIITRLFESKYKFPTPRINNGYYYLKDGIVIIPHEISYPFMGTRIYEQYNINTDEFFTIKKLHPTTICLHWEHSQFVNTSNQEKQGWTRYLHVLRNTPHIRMPHVQNH